MVVIYIGTKLMFADWIFDGHGADMNSFQKQIQKIKKEYLLGKFIAPGYLTLLY